MGERISELYLDPIPESLRPGAVRALAEGDCSVFSAKQDNLEGLMLVCVHRPPPLRASAEVADNYCERG